MINYHYTLSLSMVFAIYTEHKNSILKIYISLRPSSALESVTSSAYSSEAPTGTP